jgi:sporulation protein YlmC with PRC-barrel domain
MEEGDLVGIRDLVKAKLFDSKGTHVGHLHDLSIKRDLSSPEVTSLGAHLEWTDRVGDIELVRRAEDVVVLIPWSQVSAVDEEAMRLKGKHPELPMESAEHRWLVRADLLNEQMVDPTGARIQRVDDVLMKYVGGKLVVVGLEASGGMLLTSPSIRRFIGKLKKKYGVTYDEDIVPWESIERVEEESIVIRDVFKVE